eukprot:TRINITY_DN466_c0_g1_i1.p1 TRINITY_DN466_c0_g1~~TRINITY_DN466_c0_g1_i1.p1  ORF type:complete len:230 (+),score=47.65 TRINITY_DN466_c0_g1_i1:117-806(+)
MRGCFRMPPQEEWGEEQEVLEDEGVTSSDDDMTGDSMWEDDNEQPLGSEEEESSYDDDMTADSISGEESGCDDDVMPPELLLTVKTPKLVPGGNEKKKRKCSYTKTKDEGALDSENLARLINKSCCASRCYERFSIQNLRYIVEKWVNLPEKDKSLRLRHLLWDCHVTKDDGGNGHSCCIAGSEFKLHLEGIQCCLDFFTRVTLTSRNKLVAVIDTFRGQQSWRVLEPA